MFIRSHFVWRGIMATAGWSAWVTAISAHQPEIVVRAKNFFEKRCSFWSARAFIPFNSHLEKLRLSMSAVGTEERKIFLEWNDEWPCSMKDFYLQRSLTSSAVWFSIKTCHPSRQKGTRLCPRSLSSLFYCLVDCLPSATSCTENPPTLGTLNSTISVISPSKIDPLSSYGNTRIVVPLSMPPVEPSKFDKKFRPAKVTRPTNCIQNTFRSHPIDGINIFDENITLKTHAYDNL